MNGTVIEIISTSVFAIIGTMAIGMAIVGYVLTDANAIMRILLVIAGVLMIWVGLASSLTGTAIFVAIVLISAYQKKQRKAVTEA